MLVRHAGAGYHLELETTAMADVQRVTELVLAYVPSATPNTDDDSRLRFNLPETSTTSFKDLLAAIEDDKEKLGVLNYHMVAMTMEDVFIRYGMFSGASLLSMWSSVMFVCVCVCVCV